MLFNGNNTDVFLGYVEKIDKRIRNYLSSDNPIVGEKKDLMYYERLRGLELNHDAVGEEQMVRHIADAFNGIIRWSHPYAFHNVKTPINMLGAAAATIAMLYDPNMAEDKYCENMEKLEFEMVGYLADLAGWNLLDAGGYYTFGGTSTLLNAVKMGICKVNSEFYHTGIDDSMFVICSELEHHSILKVCNWLGIGEDNCIRIPTDENYKMDVSYAKLRIIEKLNQGKKLATIIACGGTTVQSIIDPIKEIVRMRDDIANEFSLSYIPHIHVDSVITWPLLFFRDYEFNINRGGDLESAARVIQNKASELFEVEGADSFGVDFHKTGFCPFSSSLFIVKNKKDLLLMNGVRSRGVDYISGHYSPSDIFLESSRSSIGCISSWTVIKTMGINGIQRFCFDVTKSGILLRKYISELEGFEVINPPTFGVCVLFYVSLPDSIDTYADISSKSLTKCYRFAKYNYDFYRFCLSKQNETGIMVDYSSGYEHRDSKVFIGVLKLQSFSFELDEKNIMLVTTRLERMKEEFDSSDYKIAPISNEKKFRFSYMKKDNEDKI